MPLYESDANTVKSEIATFFDVFPNGTVWLIGEEDVRPYERPPLSKDYLRGEAGTDKVFVHDGSFYEENDIELRLSTGVRWSSGNRC